MGGCNNSLSIQHQQSQIMGSSNQGASGSFFNSPEDVSGQNEAQVGMSANMGNKLL